VTDWDQIDQITFALELLAVLRQIRDELQKIGDRIAESAGKEERP
jgi:hypothetical protein